MVQGGDNKGKNGSWKIEGSTALLFSANSDTPIVNLTYLTHVLARSLEETFLDQLFRLEVKDIVVLGNVVGKVAKELHNVFQTQVALF